MNTYEYIKWNEYTQNIISTLWLHHPNESSSQPLETTILNFVLIAPLHIFYSFTIYWCLFLNICHFVLPILNFMWMKWYCTYLLWYIFLLILVNACSYSLFMYQCCIFYSMNILQFILSIILQIDIWFICLVAWGLSHKSKINSGTKLSGMQTFLRCTPYLQLGLD